MCFLDKKNDLNIQDGRYSYILNAYNHAIHSAKNSDLLQKHGSVFICDGEVITGYNHFGCSNKKNSISIHAEEDAINNFIITYRLRGYNDRYIRKKLKKSILLTVRVKGEIHRLSAPCQNCLSLIKHYGIKQIIFSVNEPQLLCAFKTKNITENRPSSGQRWITRQNSTSRHN